MSELTGKVAVVTGAAQGIGAETARQLADAGVRVVVADVDTVKGETLAHTLRDGGNAAQFIHTDVSEESAIERLIQTTTERFGGLDILVNNAWAGVKQSATSTSSEDLDHSLAVLLKAPLLAAKHAIPVMQQRGGGVIVNLGSVLGCQPILKDVAYDAAKAAVVQLSRQLALEYGPHNIRVNTVIPGAIGVRPPHDAIPDVTSVYARLTPLRRMGVPRDVANAILFLVSEQASFITGAQLIVDGGQTLPFYTNVVDAHQALLENGEEL